MRIGPPEDRQTSTLDGAAAFERGRAGAEDDDELDGYDGPDEEEEGEDERHADTCGCSDPECPCDKSGTPAERRRVRRRWQRG